MSKTIDELREHFNQRPVPNSKVIIEERSKVNAMIDAVEAENAKLREQMELLVTLLRVDCDIDASWDGLRRFWSIELTESGCLMRDSACKAEAENAKLREIVRDMRKAFFALDIDHCQSCPRDTINGPCTKHLISGSDECNFEEEMRELGIEVDGG